MTIQRRTFLRGLGASLALPWMETFAAAPGSKVLSEPPLRSGFLFFPNGVVPKNWFAENQENFTDVPMLRGLTPHRDQLTMVRNLWHQHAEGRNGHWPKVPSWLSGGFVARGNGGDIDTGGTSIDQLLARELGHQSLLPSLELGIEPPRTGIDNIGGGFPRMVGSYVSWRDPHTPVSKEIVPRLAFDRLFRSGTALPPAPGMEPRSARAIAALQRDDSSILDLVLDDAKSLQRRVSGYDRSKIDEYLESVREVERRIEASIEPPARWRNATKFAFARPDAGIPADHETHIRLMLDIMVLAFWTDSTRICTFMLGDAQSGKSFKFLPGVRDSGYHSLSHHRDDAKTRGEYEKIGTWHVDQFAYLLKRMAPLEEAGKPLLDSCQLMFGTTLSDGNRHDSHNLPLVLAGRAKGKVNPGRVLEPKRDTPMCNLLLAMAQNAGSEIESFGDSTGVLKLA